MMAEILALLSEFEGDLANAAALGFGVFVRVGAMMAVIPLLANRWCRSACALG